LNSIYLFQMLVFLCAISSLLMGLRYTVKIYSVERKNALIDSLTQIYNRKAIMFGLKRELRKSERYGHPTSVAILDLDFFKKYNDTNGHIAGDKLLKRFSRIIKESAREYDIFGRYGGEEFIIIFPETGINDAVKICERIRESIEKTRFYGQEKMPFGRVTVSIGLAETKGKKRTKKETLIHNADLNLYKAKESGRNRVIY
ncbi:GGDEF domain-containing protein, partial [Candidatus Pacearchaeota archaeon]